MSLDKFGRKSSGGGGVRGNSRNIVGLIQIENKLKHTIDDKINVLNTDLELKLLSLVKKIDGIEIINTNLQKEIDFLKNEILKIDEIILKDPPKYAKDLTTKKYVDDVIIRTKAFLRGDLKNSETDLQKLLENKIILLNENFIQLTNMVTNANKEILILKQKLV